MKQIVIYSNNNIECDRAMSYLFKQDGDLCVLYLDRDFTMKQFVSEFGEHAEFPQIAVGSRHIGGLKETLNYYERHIINIG